VSSVVLEARLVRLIDAWRRFFGFFSTDGTSNKSRWGFV
jgi:hypothetical protein